MKKKIILLPDGKKIKYRVAKEGDGWTMVEMILTPEMMEMLDHFAITEETSNEAPVSPQAETSAGEPVTTAQEPVKQPTQPMVYTDEQKTKMKDLKESLNVSDNNDLDKFVKEWSLGHLTSYKQLEPDKIDDFITFVRNEYL